MEATLDFARAAHRQQLNVNLIMYLGVDKSSFGASRSGGGVNSADLAAILAHNSLFTWRLRHLHLALRRNDRVENKVHVVFFKGLLPETAERSLI